MLRTCLDGYDNKGERLVALAHVDKHTTEESLKKVFECFTSSSGYLIGWGDCI